MTKLGPGQFEFLTLELPAEFRKARPQIGVVRVAAGDLATAHRELRKLVHRVTGIEMTSLPIPAAHRPATVRKARAR